MEYKYSANILWLSPLVRIQMFLILKQFLPNPKLIVKHISADLELAQPDRMCIATFLVHSTIAIRYQKAIGTARVNSVTTITA